MTTQDDSKVVELIIHSDSAVIKTMEMYQAIITRMAGNSAAVVRWSQPFWSLQSKKINIH